MKLNISEVEQKADEFDKERENFSKLTVQTGRQDDDAKGAPTTAGISSKFLVQEIEKKKIGEVTLPFSIGVKIQISAEEAGLEG